jgi:hypothetical protein
MKMGNERREVKKIKTVKKYKIEVNKVEWRTERNKIKIRKG